METAERAKQLEEELQRLKKELHLEKDFQERYNHLAMDFYQNHYTLEEIGRRILEQVCSITGAVQGALFYHHDSEVKMTAHRCDDPCPDCHLINLKQQIPGPQTISINLQDEQRTNSFYVNNPELNLQSENSLQCSENVLSYLTARSYMKGRLHGELILVNSPGGFKEIHLGWMENTIGLFTQVQQREEMRQALIQARTEAAEAGKSKAQFLANVSHEIRSPLNGVICMASLLQETELDEEQQELLKIVQFSAENITRIIQDLLDLTQISTGKMVIRHEPFSLNELLTPLVQNYKKDMNDNGLDFHFQIAEGLDQFTGDPVRIGQILSNLVNNALKYTDEGSVYLEVGGSGLELDVTVSDTGLGIPEEKLDSIFDQFVQLDRNGSKKSGGKGVGLGLSIVKELVELMGGTIQVRSRVGKGSTFQVTLPSSDKSLGERLQKSAPKSKEEHKVLRILVAEDDPVNMLYLHTLLTRKGYLVDKAENGIAAVNLCRLNQYDLVLMDVSMPQKDGMEATKEIRQFAPDLRILAVTAHAYEGDRKKILESGMNGVVLKPIDEEELLQAVAQ